MRQFKLLALPSKLAQGHYNPILFLIFPFRVLTTTIQLTILNVLITPQVLTDSQKDAIWQILHANK
jgi:hypothetical protein